MTPIERAAKAVEDILLDEPRYNEFDGKVTKVTSESHFDYMTAAICEGATTVEGAMANDIVRAVLTAIREPSEGMAEQAFRNGACGGHEDCWKAMIDAAIAEGQPA